MRRVRQNPSGAEWDIDSIEAPQQTCVMDSSLSMIVVSAVYVYAW